MFALLFCLAAAEIVYRIFRILNDFANLIEADRTRVVAFSGYARLEAQIDNAKQDGLENRFVVLVERTVYEDGFLERPPGQYSPFRWKRIVPAIGISLPYAPITTMNVEFRLLIAGDIPRPINGFFLSAIGS